MINIEHTGQPHEKDFMANITGLDWESFIYIIEGLQAYYGSCLSVAGADFKQFQTHASQLPADQRQDLMEYLGFDRTKSKLTKADFTNGTKYLKSRADRVSRLIDELQRPFADEKQTAEDDSGEFGEGLDI